MNTKKSLLSMSLCAVLAAAAGGVQATSLEELIRTQGTITAGDKLFDQWELILNGPVAGGGIPADLSTLDVTPIDSSGDPDPNDPGPGLNFTFNPGHTVTGDGVYAYTDLNFGFRASSLDPGYLIKDASLGGPFGSLTSLQGLNCTPSTSGIPCNDVGMAIVEKVYADAAKSILLGQMTAEWSYLDGTSINQSGGGINFAPQSSVWIDKNILVWAVTEVVNDPQGGSPTQGDIASLSGFTQRFSQAPGDHKVPEPSSLLLLGIGLAALVRRRYC
jgi:hypothetical protein